MNWVQRKIYLYNVTFGLYMLDWWERCLFKVYQKLSINGSFIRYLKMINFAALTILLPDTLVLVLMWFVCYNGFQRATQFYTRFSLSNVEVVPGFDNLSQHGASFQ